VIATRTPGNDPRVGARDNLMVTHKEPLAQLRAVLFFGRAYTAVHYIFFAFNIRFTQMNNIR